MVIYLVSLLLTLFATFLSVAFFSLLQRKLLALTANRKAPDKVGLLGVLQPFLDAVKLLSKEMVFPTSSLNYLWMLYPPILLILVSFLFILMNTWCTFSSLHTSLLILVLLSLEVYCVMLSGFFSGSKYSVLGGVRSALLGMSSEIATALLVFSIQLFMGGAKLSETLSPFLWVLLPPWLMFLLIDTSTSPFDLTESESELVSGFNTEYGSSFFMLLFLSEYMKMILLSFLTSFLFFASSLAVFMSVMVFLLMSQCTFLRFKPDQLMGSMWLSYLPLILFSFMLIMFF